MPTATRLSTTLLTPARPTDRLRRLSRGGTLIAAALTPALLWFGSPSEAHAQTYRQDVSDNPLRNPLGAIGDSAPAYGDLDGDGDLDLVVGGLDGTLKYFENTGTATTPDFTQRIEAANPVGGVTVGNRATPTLADLDGDLDLDLVVGENNGALNYYENVGTTLAPVFLERNGAASPVDGIDVGLNSAPAFADLDGDLDLDFIVGGSSGSLNYYENTGTTLAPVLTERTGAANPFDGVVNVGRDTKPTLADIDGDGDLDAVVGEYLGRLNYFENTGTTLAPVFTQRTGAANPFDGLTGEVGIGTRDSDPALVDLDGDGDLDLTFGDDGGLLFYFENTGTALAPTFTFRDGAASPFNGFDVGARSTPAFRDLDGDLDLDAVAGAGDGTLNYYENTGTALAPVYIERTDAANPFDGIDVGTNSAPSLVDIDGDTDTDAVVGAGDGTVLYFENTGTALAPVFTQRTGAANPFDDFSFGNDSAPTFADLDGDSDLDAIVGFKNGGLSYLENTGTALAPTFTSRLGGDNPFNAVDPGYNSTPTFADIDGDSDLDLVLGEKDGVLNYYENTGTALAPVFIQRTGAANPFDSFDVGSNSAPRLVDIDGDLSIEMIVGADDGRFTFLETDFEALPVELTAFDAKLDGDAALLTWTTASETNNAGFEVERLLGDAGALVAETLGSVAGAGTTTESQTYTFRTSSLTPGVHRFRLRQVDYDGGFEYSATVEVSVAQAEALRLAAYPNPANAESGFALDVSARHSGLLVVEIYDVLGRRVDSLVESDVSAGEVVSVRVGGLVSGVYFVRARQGSHVTTQRVSVVR